MNIFVYQRGKQSGPLTQDEVRLRLLSGSLKPTHLVWHSRLSEWLPIGKLAHAPLLEEELSEAPDPTASSHYVPASKPREEAPAPRRRRSSQGGRSRSLVVEEEVPAPTAAAVQSRREPSREKLRREAPQSEEAPKRVRRMRTPKPQQESETINWWKLIKDFFQN